MRPRVLFVDFAPTAGGSIQSLRQILVHLPRQRYQPLALLSPAVMADPVMQGLDVPLFGYDAGQGRPLPAAAATAAVQQSALAGRWRQHPWLGGLWRTGSLLRRLRGKTLPAARAIARLIDAEEVDLVHLNDALPLAEPGILAAWWKRRPSVVLVRSFARVDRFQALISRLPAAGIVTSEVLREDQVRQKTRFKRVFTLPNAVDLAAYRQQPDREGVRRDCGLPDDAIIVIVVGRLMRRKGLDVFIRALAQLAPRHPRLHGLIVGGEEISERGLQAELAQLAAELEIAGRVHFSGPRHDVPRLLLASDIASFVPTEPEPFGRVIIEAMAAGLPVIGANHGAIPDIIRAEETGLLVPATDPTALAAALETLLTQPALARRMGEAGRRRVAAHYSITQQMQQLCAIYDEIL